jgi:hypothetical protein
MIDAVFTLLLIAAPAVLVFAAVRFAEWLDEAQSQFRLRSLLITTTLLAVAMGLIVYTAKK